MDDDTPGRLAERKLVNDLKGFTWVMVVKPDPWQ